MIGKYLLNTNESAIVHVLQNFLEVNKAVFSFWREKFRDTVALSFVYGNYYPTMD